MNSRVSSLRDDPILAWPGRGLSRMFRRTWHSPTAMTWGSLAVRLSAVVLVLPVVLVRFAPAEVALWQLFATLTALALMLDFGLAPTLARLLSFARGGADLPALRYGLVAGASVLPPASDPEAGAAAQGTAAPALMATLRWLYPRMALGLVAVLAVLGTWALQIPVSQVAQTDEAWLAWALVVLSTGVSLWGGAYSAALQGMDRIAVMRRWEVAAGLAQLLSVFVVLAAGCDLLALVATYQLWAVLGVLRNVWLLRRLHPELFRQRAQAHPLALQVLWAPAWRSGLGVLMCQGAIQFSGVVYSQLAPAAEVAAYLIALRVASMVSLFSQAPFYSKLPRLAELQASGQRTEQLRLARRGMGLAHAAFVPAMLGVAFAAQALLDLIGSQTPFVAPGVWAVLVLALFAERFGAMHLQLYSLTNHILWHVANGLAGAVMVLTAALVYPWVKVYAFPLAMLLAYGGVYATYCAWHSRRAFGLGLLAFESRAALPALAVLLVGLMVSLWWAPAAIGA